MKLNPSHPTIILPDPSRNRRAGWAKVEPSTLLCGYRAEQIDAFHEDILMIPDDLRSPTPIRRLIVLVPEEEINESALARRVWALASSSMLNVLYLAVPADPTHLGSLRRRLVTLASMTSIGNVQAAIQMVQDSDWRQSLDALFHPGDLLVCLEQHRIPYRWIGHRNVAELLSTAFSVPIYSLGGIKVGVDTEQWIWIREMMAWLASLALMIAFFGLQGWVGRTVHNPLSTILLVVSIVLEIYFIFRVNEWVG